MILAHSLLRRNVAEDVGLLLIGSSHAHWTRSALLRCNFSDFFRSLLESTLQKFTVAEPSDESDIKTRLPVDPMAKERRVIPLREKPRPAGRMSDCELQS